MISKIKTATAAIFPIFSFMKNHEPIEDLKKRETNQIEFKIGANELKNLASFLNKKDLRQFAKTSKENQKGISKYKQYLKTEEYDKDIFKSNLSKEQKKEMLRQKYHFVSFYTIENESEQNFPEIDRFKKLEFSKIYVLMKMMNDSRVKIKFSHKEGEICRFEVDLLTYLPSYLSEYGPGELYPFDLLSRMNKEEINQALCALNYLVPNLFYKTDFTSEKIIVRGNKVIFTNPPREKPRSWIIGYPSQRQILNEIIQICDNEKQNWQESCDNFASELGTREELKQALSGEWISERRFYENKPFEKKYYYLCLIGIHRGLIISSLASFF